MSMSEYYNLHSRIFLDDFVGSPLIGVFAREQAHSPVYIFRG